MIEMIQMLQMLQTLQMPQMLQILQTLQTLQMLQIKVTDEATVYVNNEHLEHFVMGTIGSSSSRCLF